MTSTPTIPSSSEFRARPSTLRRLWRASQPLTTVGLLMLVVASASVVGLFSDPRVITGVPAWLKPFKFAISTAIYSLTLAWMFQWLTDWPRVRRMVGWTTAVVFVMEVGIIDTQAWRGTTSHFNAATAVDATLFAIMGGAILAQTLASVAVVIALWRQRFSDGALGWALRLGMAFTVVGALSGGLMTQPTAEQHGNIRRLKRSDGPRVNPFNRPQRRTQQEIDVHFQRACATGHAVEVQTPLLSGVLRRHSTSLDADASAYGTDGLLDLGTVGKRAVAIDSPDVVQVDIDG